MKKASIPFPTVNPGDIVVKVCMTSNLQVFHLVYNFISGRILWCQLHRYIFSLGALQIQVASSRPWV